MLWRIFFCSSVSTFTLSFFNQIKEHGFHEIDLTSAGTLKFGQLQNTKVKVEDLHGPIIMGILGGALGSLFINVNTRLSRLRKRCITNNCKKIIETGAFGVLMITAATISIGILNKCVDMPQYEEQDLEKAKYEEEIRHFNPWTCDKET